ncbi:bifunctional DNA primase/polymerase, partial [Streptomyces calidiresistens]|uniref:bifunctional DNA primase/polymerase n=1 Tax=Streptomyces calidiresistens TaxID=1485586 RepID=UPI001E649949
HPLSPAWQTQAGTDSGRVLRWLRAEPEANFVTATGRVHDVLDVPLEAGHAALERLAAAGVEVGPVALIEQDRRMLFFTATRGTPEDEDEWWPCELDCHPETMAEHPGLRWHCRGSYVLVPPARLPGPIGAGSAAPAVTGGEQQILPGPGGGVRPGGASGRTGPHPSGQSALAFHGLTTASLLRGPRGRCPTILPCARREWVIRRTPKGRKR